MDRGVVRRRRPRRVAATAALLAIAAALAACGDDDDDSSETSTGATAASSSAPAATDAPVGTTGATADVTAPTDSSAVTEAPETTGGGPATGEPFEVALLGDMTGPFAANGTAGVGGIQAAIESVNAAGGIDGHPIELSVPIDAMSTPEGAQAAAVQALSAEPVAMVGQIVSGGVAGMVPVLEQGLVPYVTPQGLDNLTGPDPVPWMFTVSSTSLQQGIAQVAEMTALLGGSAEGKTIAFVGLSSPAVDATYATVQQQVEEAGAINGVAERTATGQIASFTAQAANLVASDPDGIIAVDSVANTVIITQALRDAGFTGPITTSTGANDDVTLETINMPNVHVPRVYNTVDASEDLAAAAEAAGVMDVTQNGFFSPGYAAGMALAAGLRNCGFPCSPEEFTPALETVGPIDLGDVAFGPLTFDADRHYGVTVMQFFVWDDAAKESVAEGDPIEL